MTEGAQKFLDETLTYLNYEGSTEIITEASLEYKKLHRDVFELNLRSLLRIFNENKTRTRDDVKNLDENIYEVINHFKLFPKLFKFNEDTFLYSEIFLETRDILKCKYFGKIKKSEGMFILQNGEFLITEEKMNDLKWKEENFDNIKKSLKNTSISNLRKIKSILQKEN